VAAAVERLVGRPLFWVGCMALLFGVPFASGLSRQALPSLPVLAPVPSVSLEDDEGRPVDAAALRGQVWVAGFLEEGSAAEVVRLLSRLQARTRNVGSAFALVAVSHGAEPPAPRPRRWRYVRGRDADRLSDATASLTGSSTPLSAKLLLVDGEGRARSVHTTEPASVDRLLGEVTLLLATAR